MLFLEYTNRTRRAISSRDAIYNIPMEYSVLILADGLLIHVHNIIQIFEIVLNIDTFGGVSVL